MKKYNLLNNALGWLCFVIAAVTYMLTLEPTASFWDCPEFISQGYKLEVGHPPGNPIFMLAARFFINFAAGDVTKVALMVNAMSGLLSAATILLLFWTITHLAKKLVVRDDAQEVSLVQMIVIFGAGLCGALMYTWSDTFWFSAVEGEVYAFSSFCTALVFWLILKWENRADQPHSDRYLILIAYVIGISIAVHLLNLLCIPAIVLVIYYKKFKNTNAKGSLVALLISFAIVALILFGLVPGFMEVAGYFELFFVNSLGLSYNMGVLIYAVILVACFIWGIYEVYSQRSPLRIKVSFALSVLLSGIPFIGDSMLIPVLVMAVLIAYLFMAKTLHVRVLNVTLLSIFVIFIGYASYALLLIRSSANPPMNQNEPDNVFSLSSYMSREQYGDTPLLYGQTPYSSVVYKLTASGDYEPMVKEGASNYAKTVKSSPDEPDKYHFLGKKQKNINTPELDMLFPRIYSGQFIPSYKSWIGMSTDESFGNMVDATIAVDEKGETIRSELRQKPTFGQSLKYFLNYQLNHMYWRYFMWNFAGRQNDIQGNGEVNQGNWVSGIPFIDNPRLGDQSLLPPEMGSANKGHNVFYMLPLLMGIFGIIWQSFRSKRGIEQFWVVFFLFFMTGIAIVLYLNQTPNQPRERDYAFAGSFYAFAIWVGLGVPAIARALTSLVKKKLTAKKTSGVSKAAEAAGEDHEFDIKAAIIAAVIGLIVPLQVVSQTWDDHDRSGRYTARDFGFNYLNSLDENAIIFTNGDNDTFPLWYAQEVEGVRTDVKVVNQSYLTTDWYANQVKHPSYNAKAINTIAKPEDYAYDSLQYCYLTMTDDEPVAMGTALKNLYDSPVDPRMQVRVMPSSTLFLPTNLDAAVKSGRITAEERAAASDTLTLDLATVPAVQQQPILTLANLMTLDILTSSVANGWDRPIYFASTVPDEYYIGLTPWMRSTGMAYEISPIYNAEAADGRSPGVNTEKMYVNVTEKFRWGGLDKISSPDDIYLDESVRRMVSSTRSQLIDLAQALYNEGVEASDTTKTELTPLAKDKFHKANVILDIIVEKLPSSVAPYSIRMGYDIAETYYRLGTQLGDDKLKQKAYDLLQSEIERYGRNVKYYQSLKPWQFATLQYADEYIYRVYFMDLIVAFTQWGGDTQALMDLPIMKEIDFDRMERNM